MDGKTFYKSKVVSKNLNPAWNESFSFPVRDLEQKLVVKVYDKDLRSHDYMGGSCVAINKLELDKTTEMVLKLEDPNSRERNMGVIIIDACLSIRDGPTKRNLRGAGASAVQMGQESAALLLSVPVLSHHMEAIARPLSSSTASAGATYC
ncbi:hypothetical protein ACEWY4_027750 [Coilia grayii]|uniref:C2 domain-containing protein n=1 Tax=Coilia grayii TaxID=363190 RepID=A0ABD1INR2_9TELE